MRKILRGGGDFSEEDPRPRPMFSGRKAGGGGIKVTTCEIPPDAPKHRGRYPFRIEGTAPSGLVLADVATMLEARFQGDPKFNLRHSQDEAVKRLKDRMEKRLEKLREAEERAVQNADNLEEKRAEYEKTKEQIKDEALKDLVDRRNQLADEIQREEQRAERIREEIEELQGELNEEKTSAADRKAAMEAGQDRVLRSMGTDSLDEPFLSTDQANDMAADLIDHWRSTLQDWEAMPMASEFDDLAGMLAKLLGKTIGKVNDRWRDAGRPDPAPEPKSDPMPTVDRGKDNLF
jgi:hypothetical protein